MAAFPPIRPPYPPANAPTPTNYCRDPDNSDVYELESLVLAGVMALSLLHALGALRRRSSHRLLHAAVTLVCAQSYALVSYAVGRMRTSRGCVPEFPVWAVCLLLVLGGADCLTARSLGELDGWRDAYLNHLGLAVLIVGVFGSINSDYIWPLSPILFIAVLRVYARVASLRMVGCADRLRKTVKPIADYMQHEHRLAMDPNLKPDPVTMEGYRYVVAGDPTHHKSSVSRPDLREEDMKIMTVEQIWQCTGSLVCSERGLQIKDVCLSMALSRMLNRRFVGFELAEAGLEKTRNFVFQGLLAGDKSHERAFRVIEEELAFVHDLYYTRYAYLYHKGCYLALCLPIAMVIFCSWLSYLLYRNLEQRGSNTRSGVHAGATMVLMAVVMFLEGLQMYLYMASGWFKVALIRSYVTWPVLQREGSFLQMIMGLLLRLKALRPWHGKLGQYSLLRALHTSNRFNNCLHYVTISMVLFQKTIFMVSKVDKGRARGKSVRMSEQVKRAIVASLAGSDGRLTNGVRSLWSNGVHAELSWACDTSDGTVTTTILVWHLATEICKHQLDDASRARLPGVGEDNAAASVSVASSLSQYCAYLVAFAPSLLPDHRSVSDSILGETISEARKLLRGAKTMEEKYDRLMTDGAARGDGDGVVVRGARLARQLNNGIQNPVDRWKVLADFWAEMVLYVAPSDHARAHLEALSRGGEFVTHLWALLTHAGVLQRAPAPAGSLPAVV